MLLLVFRAARFSRGCPFRSAPLCCVLSVRDCAGQRRTDRHHHTDSVVPATRRHSAARAMLDQERRAPHGLADSRGLAGVAAGAELPAFGAGGPAGAVAAVAAQSNGAAVSYTHLRAHE